MGKGVAILVLAGGMVAHTAAGQDAMAGALAPAPGSAMRILVDPATGERWVLERDAANPGGPGRLTAAGRVARPGMAKPSWIIRAGDRVVVERHTPILDEALEAVALGSAAAGGRLSVRITLGARVEEARAMGPGRAEMDDGLEAGR